jgi:uncharacterized protein (TIGR00730 family)
MKIAVYLGSNCGQDVLFQKAAAELGDWIAENHHTLVYGGAGLGLMDILAQHVLQGNGKVIGVMPQFMLDAGRNRTDLSELIVTEDMSSRKKKMMELGEAYLAMPGGPGTLEEISEVISSSRLGLLQDRPCMCFNLHGYYDLLKEMLQQMQTAGFVSESEMEHVFFPSTMTEIVSLLK